MILTHQVAHGVAAGTVTQAYRRWSKPRVAAGSSFRTVAGVVRIEAIEAVDPDQVDDAAAKAAGSASAAELLGGLTGGNPDDPLWRITLSWAGPDARDALARDDALTSAEIAEIEALLDRLDARTPWARATLIRLADQPGATAARLAERLPFDKEALKRRLRQLKERGLTHSLPTGYELSPRGRAYLAGRDAGGSRQEP